MKMLLFAIPSGIRLTFAAPWPRPLVAAGHEVHLAAAEPMARYQAALDNELYKAIRALREAQAHRRANAVLEASPVAEVAG